MRESIYNWRRPLNSKKICPSNKVAPYLELAAYCRESMMFLRIWKLVLLSYWFESQWRNFLLVQFYTYVYSRSRFNFSSQLILQTPTLFHIKVFGKPEKFGVIKDMKTKKKKGKKKKRKEKRKWWKQYRTQSGNMYYLHCADVQQKNGPQRYLLLLLHTRK